MSPMPVTAADFNLQGRVENYRERLTELLIELDRLVQEHLQLANQTKLHGNGGVRYERQPTRWTLAWNAAGHRYTDHLMAVAPTGRASGSQRP